MSIRFDTYKYLLIILFCFGSQISLSQNVLTLHDAINLALKNNYDIEISRNNLLIDSINNHIGVAGGLPTVNGVLNDQQSVTSVNQKLNNGTNIVRSGAGSNALSIGITGSYLLYNGYRVVATKNRLETLEKQSRQLLNAQIQNTIAEVMITYYNILRQQGFIKTVEQLIEVTNKRKELFESRKSVGLANNADIFQSTIDLNTSRQELLSQQLTLQQSKADLMYLLKQSPDSSFTIADSIMVDKNVQIDTIRNFINSNPEYVAAQLQVDVNALVEKEVNALRSPSVRLNTGYNYIRNQSAAGFTLLNQNYGPFIGLNVQVPIFNGGVTKRQQQVATINTNSARANVEDINNQMQTSVSKAWNTYQTTLSRLTAEQENNKMAADLLWLTQQRFQLQAANIVELREAEKSFIDAGYRLIILAHAAKMAEIELKRIGGRLGE